MGSRGIVLGSVRARSATSVAVPRGNFISERPCPRPTQARRDLLIGLFPAGNHRVQLQVHKPERCPSQAGLSNFRLYFCETVAQKDQANNPRLTGPPSGLDALVRDQSPQPDDGIRPPVPADRSEPEEPLHSRCVPTGDQSDNACARHSSCGPPEDGLFSQ